MDNYLKNLQSIEINSIEDFVKKHSLDPMILLGVKSLVVSRFDELITSELQLDSSFDEPELVGEVFDVDFIKSMSNAAILKEIADYVSVDEYMLAELNDTHAFSTIDLDWQDDNNTQIWTLETGNKDILVVRIDADGNATTTLKQEI
jgi:hypothetical protein